MTLECALGRSMFVGEHGLRAPALAPLPCRRHHPREGRFGAPPRAGWVFDPCSPRRGSGGTMLKSPPRPADARPRDRDLASLPDLLVAGGDERLRLDPATGLNLYGRSPLPRDGALELGSCTMSSMSPLAMASSDRLFRRLSRAWAAGTLAPVVEDAYERLRAELLAALDIEDRSDVQVVLTPSGTDAELVPLTLAAGRARGRIRNILVGPEEAGSGSALAAGGLHPKDFTPFGGRRGTGAALAGGLAARTSVVEVALREADGDLRPLGALDDEVTTIAEEAIRAGETVIVHRIAHSKTGVFAPTLSCVRQLVERHGQRVLVVVDAAQGRIGAATIRRHLADGDLVLLTGSKFYGGPPFSSAVLVPASARLPEAPAPEGLFDYLSASDLPPRWAQARSLCGHHANLGLLLRWAAALAEIRAYRGLPRAVQREIVDAFGDSVRGRLAHHPCAILEPAPPRDLTTSAGEAEPQEALPTVFSFALRRRQGARSHPLGAAELKGIAAQLASGGDAWSRIDVPAALRAALAPCFHVGQPVRLGAGDDRAVLRVAIGAPLVRRVAEDASLGARLSDRIAWLDGRVEALSAKLDVLLDERLAGTPGVRPS
jgi:hypothetical protein